MRLESDIISIFVWINKKFCFSTLEDNFIYLNINSKMNDAERQATMNLQYTTEREVSLSLNYSKFLQISGE